MRLETITDLELNEHVPLAGYTSMGVGGPARWLARVNSMDAMREVLNWAETTGNRWMVLGGGSNTLFTHEGYRGLVILLGKEFRKIVAGPEPHQITAGAAAQLSAAMNFSKRAALTGLEWAAGVPGTVGGALAGNAGTPAGEICPQTARVHVLTHGGEERYLEQGQFEYSYRRSELKQYIILGATINLEPGDAEAIQTTINAALEKRWTQPVGVKCSGCMFKNPEGDFAGRLIEQAGLKGTRVGGARVADEHANFIVNDQNATAEDINRLVNSIRRQVLEKFGVELESEVRLVEP